MLCKEHNKSETLSLREKKKEDVINNSADVDNKNKVTMASFPLMQNPSIKLAPNKDKALQMQPTKTKTRSKSSRFH